MKDLAERFHEVGVVPVVVLEDAKDAVPLAQALVEGGLPCAELLSVQRQQKSPSV